MGVPQKIIKIYPRSLNIVDTVNSRLKMYNGTLLK